MSCDLQTGGMCVYRCITHIHNQLNTKWFPICCLWHLSFLLSRSLSQCTFLDLDKAATPPHLKDAHVCLCTRPLSCAHTHVLASLSVTCKDRNSSRLRFGVCADTKNSTEGRRGLRAGWVPHASS